MVPPRLFLRWVPALLLVMAMHGAFLFYWAGKNSIPLAWDQAVHAKIAMNYRDNLAHESVLDVLRPQTFSYPPLYHFMLIASLPYATDVSDAGLPVNFFFLCVLMLSVFLIGNELMGAWQGFTAAVLVTVYPNIVWITRTMLIDLPLTACVALSLYMLIRSRNFSSTIGSVLFGISVGIGMLAKWTAAAYVAFPALYALWIGLRNKRWANVLLALVAGLLVMFPWYGQNVFPILVEIPILSGLPPASGEATTALAKVFWYPNTFAAQMGLLFVFLFVPGLIAVLWRPKVLPIVLWFLGSLILFSLIRNKNVRYFAPALPAVALLSVAWLPSLKQLPMIAVCAAALFQFVNYNRSHPPEAQDWHHRDIIDRVVELHGNNPTPASVLMVANQPYFHSASLNLTARANRGARVAFHAPSKSRPFEFADFVLIKTGDLGPAFTLGNINRCAEIINKPEKWFTQTFREVQRWPLPDKSEAVLYFCDPHPVKVSDPGLFNISLNELELPHIKAYGVELRVTPLSLADTQVGRFKELRVRCDRLIYKSIEFRDVLVRLVKPQINLPLYFDTQEIQLLRLGKLTPRATISSDVLLATAAEKVKWLKSPSVQFDGPLIRLAGRAAGIPITVAAEVMIQQKMLISHIKSLRVAGIPVPLFFVRAIVNQRIPLTRNGEWEYDIDVDRIQGTGTSLTLGTT